MFCLVTSTACAGVSPCRSWCRCGLNVTVEFYLGLCRQFTDSLLVLRTGFSAIRLGEHQSCAWVGLSGQQDLPPQKAGGSTQQVLPVMQEKGRSWWGEQKLQMCYFDTLLHWILFLEIPFWFLHLSRVLLCSCVVSRPIWITEALNFLWVLGPTGILATSESKSLPVLGSGASAAQAALNKKDVETEFTSKVPKSGPVPNQPKGATGSKPTLQ